MLPSAAMLTMRLHAGASATTPACTITEHPFEHNLRQPGCSLSKTFQTSSWYYTLAMTVTILSFHTVKCCGSWLGPRSDSCGRR